jgi:hypothetical protein
MNNLTNKAYLWDECIQQGLFNNINKDDVTKIQTIFENTIKIFDSRKEDISILNKEFFILIKNEIDKLNTFEERQKSYDALLNKPPPSKIDFSDKIDEPIKNIDSLVEQTQTIRNEVFTAIEPKQKDNIDWAKVIKTQNDILIKILETQYKILEIIKNK